MYRFVVKKTYNKYIRKRKPTIPINAVVVEKEVYPPAKKEPPKPVIVVKEEAPSPAHVVVEEQPVVNTEEITPKPKRKRKNTAKPKDTNTPKEEETNNGEQI